MSSARNLVLTGFMGTGKTSVGLELAGKLGMAFIDTDELIESRHGPIARIFEMEGEEAFRDLERVVARELGQRTGLVIATGGGMLLDRENLEELSRHGRVFCLTASPEEIMRRVVEDPSRIERPLLSVADPRRRIADMLDERSSVYGRFTQVDTEHAEPGAIADVIVGLWRDQGG